MNSALLIKNATIRRWFLKRLAYYANGWFSIEKNTLNKIDESEAFIVIVAKTHYTETWKSFSSISKKELNKIISLQKQNEPLVKNIFQSIENTAIDGFDVKTTTFDQQLIDIIGEHRLLIPETELFSDNTAIESILSLDTPSGTLFVSGTTKKLVSSYAKGLMADINTFKLSSGLSSNATVTVVPIEKYGRFLLDKLKSVQLNTFINRIAYDPKAWFKAKDLHLLYWAPLISATCFYVLLNSFIWLQANTIENELSSQGNEVNQLLSDKRELDNKNSLLNVLNNEFVKTNTVHNHWSLAYHLVENGMTITRLTYKEATITIRGNAKKASSVLAAISKHPQVESAVFKGPVRQSRGKDTFILELIPKTQKVNKDEQAIINKPTVEQEL